MRVSISTFNLNNLSLPEYTLIDQIWLSPRLASRQMGAFIDRRRLHGGDGRDHDPAWVELEF